MIDFATTLQSLGLLMPALLVLVKATLILAIARLLLLALPQLSAATKHLGITLALIGAIALPIVGLVVPAWRVAVLPSASNGAPASAAAIPAKAADSSKTIGATGDDDELPRGTVATAITVAKAAGVVQEAKLDAFERALDAAKGSWQGFLLMAIGAVSLAFLFRMAVGIAGVGVVARLSHEITDEHALRELDRACDHLRLPLAVRLLRSDRVSVPVVWGLAKPILLLPASSAEWPAERLRVVLLHELAHIKRWDGLTLLVTKAAVALFWFHPLMWSLERLARAECERACDDLVLESGTRPSDYAEHLLSIAKALPQADPFRSVTLAMSRRSQLEGRLLSILQPHVRRAHFSLTTVSMVAALSLLVLVPLASVRLVAAPQPPSSSTVTVVAEKSEAHDSFDLEKLVDTKDVLLAKYEKLTAKRAPSTGKEWYEHAYELHRADRFPEAIDAFKQAVNRGYRVDDAMYNIACGYAQLDDPANAVKWLRDAIAAGYDNFEHIAGDSDFDPIRSTREFKQVMSEAPEHARRKSEDRLDSVMHRYEMLSRLPSAEGEAWFSVGYDLLPLRQYDRSIEAFRHALEKGYKPSTTSYNIACGYSRKGDVATAEQWLTKAINEGFDSIDKLDDDPDIDNLRKSARFAQLRQMADELRLHPKRGFFDFGGDWVDALPRFREMTAKYPSHGRSWFNLGYAALQAGQNSESISAFKHALDLNYRAPTTMYNIACGYARSNQSDAALEWLQKSRQAGFNLFHYIDNDNDLDNLRSDRRFRELQRELRREK